VRLDKVCRLDGSLGVLFDPEAAACPGQSRDHQSVPGAQDLEEKKHNFIIAAVDPHPLFNSDPDPSFHFNADPDQTIHFNAVPDPAHQSDANS
jgi:hypothetical protein